MTTYFKHNSISVVVGSHGILTDAPFRDPQSAAGEEASFKRDNMGASWLKDVATIPHDSWFTGWRILQVVNALAPLTGLPTTASSS